jgi:hypothetical protein
MAVAIVVVSYVCGVLAILHAISAPQSAWVEADRNRGYWLGTMGVLTLFALGLVAAIAYAVSVVPRLKRDTSTPFRK